MKVLITGGRGMLGTDLTGCLETEHDVAVADIEEFDITDEKSTLEGISGAAPDLVVHTAAYTHVDGCEENPEPAFRVNAEGTRNVARACQSCSAGLVYMSTDYVFDGKKRQPYVEADEPNPLGVYGRSKLGGERYVREVADHLIIRTSWLYGHNGKNFIKSILKLCETKNDLPVVNDQTGVPTSTVDLSLAIKDLLPLNCTGIINVCNSGHCTWYEFAKAIVQTAGIQGVKVRPITTPEYPLPAARPEYSVLSTSRFTELVGRSMRHWKDALSAYLSGQQ